MEIPIEISNQVDVELIRLGVITVNHSTYILGGADSSNFPPANEREIGTIKPTFEGDFTDYVANFNHSPQLYNLVKVCDSCGKVCAYSIDECNGCGASLENTQTSQSNNILVGFIHGISRGPFSLKVSLRFESEDLLVFDDPLAMTRAHVCAIPTDVYIPDLRYLFEHPRTGLELVHKLSNAAWNAVETHFIEDSQWVMKALSEEARSLDRESLRSHMFAGFNLPPSQYQLHLQYLLPPFTPHHYSMFRAGHHFTPHRCFSLRWVEESLRVLIDFGSRIENAAQMNSIDLCNVVKELTGVDYDQIQAEEIERYESTHKLFANYSVDDFEYALPEADSSAPPLKLATLLSEGKEEPVEGVSRKQVDDQDKLTLQSYGRPYDASGNPSGVYYSFPKPSPLAELNDIGGSGS